MHKLWIVADIGRALLAVAVRDTLKQAGADGRVTVPPDRSLFWRYTPQMFARRCVQALGDALGPAAPCYRMSFQQWSELVWLSTGEGRAGQYSRSLVRRYGLACPATMTVLRFQAQTYPLILPFVTCSGGVRFVHAIPLTCVLSKYAVRIYSYFACRFRPASLPLFTLLVVLFQCHSLGAKSMMGSVVSLLDLAR